MPQHNNTKTVPLEPECIRQIREQLKAQMQVVQANGHTFVAPGFSPSRYVGPPSMRCTSDYEGRYPITWPEEKAPEPRCPISEARRRRRAGTSGA